MDNNFDGMTEHPKTLRAVTENLYWDALECVPPVWGSTRSVFAMGEIYSGDSYFWFTQIKGRYYGFLGTQAEAEAAFDEKRREASAIVCQDCNQYKDGLTRHGALMLCPKCKGKAEASATARRQGDLFTEQKPLFNF